MRLPRVSIVGAPNAGKSTLYNRLIKNSLQPGYRVLKAPALVSPVAGTTRDRLIGRVDWHDAAFTLIDTGGVLGLEGLLPAKAGAKKVIPKRGAKPSASSDILAKAAAADQDQKDDALETVDIFDAVEEQVLTAIDDASVILFMVDVNAGVTVTDEYIARALRPVMRNGPPAVLLVANKVDTEMHEYQVHDFWKLGLGEPFSLSAQHGSGTGDLLDRIVSILQERGDLVDKHSEAESDEELEMLISEAEAKLSSAKQREANVRVMESEFEEEVAFPEDESIYDIARAEVAEVADDFGSELDGSQVIKVAVVGRPNVGKSSLLNRLTGENRLVVHETPGTTRDVVPLPFTWRDHEFILLDTAGIRKHEAGGQEREMLDRVAVRRALQAIADCHVALLLLDAKQGLQRQDMVIASLVVDQMKSCIFVANKSDLCTPREYKKIQTDIEERLGSLKYAPILYTSAKEGTGIDEALQLVVEAANARRQRVSKRELNEVLKRAMLIKPMPYIKGARLRIKYATQKQTEVPTFLMYINRSVSLHPSVSKWIENTIRSRWSYPATPIRLQYIADTRKRRPKPIPLTRGKTKIIKKVPRVKGTPKSVFAEKLAQRKLARYTRKSTTEK